MNNMNYKYLIILAGAFLMLFIISEFIYRVFHVKTEYTRKFVHIGTGLLTMFFPILLSSHWEVLFLCASFMFILILSFKFKFLPSVNAIKRKSFGSICYPIAVYFSYLAFSIVKARGVSTLAPLLFYYLPILIMALCDPIAALVGKKYPIRKYKVGSGTKSIGGSSSFLIAAVVLTLSLMFSFQSEFSFWLLVITALLTSISTMIVEAISPNGFDNFTIPATAIASLLLVNFYLFIQ